MGKTTAFPGIETAYPDLGDVPTDNEANVVAGGKDYNATIQQFFAIAVELGISTGTASALATSLAPYTEGGGGGGNSFALLDEDDFASDSDIAAPSQQSTKAYIASQVSSATPADGSVTNAKLANVATATFKGRTTGGTGAPEDLTVAQARTLLNVEDGATADMTAAEMADVLEATPSLSYVAVDDLGGSPAGAVVAQALIAYLGASGGEFIHVNTDGDDLEIASGEPDESTPGTATQAAGAITLNFTGLSVLNTTTSANITTITITTDSIPLYGMCEWHVVFGGSHTITIPTGAYSSAASVAGTSGQRVPIIIKRVASSEFEYRLGSIMAVI
jgi:hypothetical protein